MSPDGRCVVLLAAEGHQHGVVVGSVRLEDVVRVLAVHQSNGCVDVLLGHVLERWCVRIIKSFLKVTNILLFIRQQLYELLFEGPV